MTAGLKNITSPFTLTQYLKNGTITKAFYKNIPSLKKDLSSFRLTHIGKLDKIVVKRDDFIIDEILIGDKANKPDRYTIELLRVPYDSMDEKTKDFLVNSADYMRCTDGIEAYLISKDVVRACYNKTQSYAIINDTSRLLSEMKDSTYILLYNPNDMN